MNNILITGCCGYVGTELTAYLLNKGHSIVGIDTCWFGNNLKKHNNLIFYKHDIRDLDDLDLQFDKIDTIIHLANIANDPSADLNPNLSWETNVLASMKLCEIAKKNKIKKIIYASSGSVYGIKSEKNVTEDLSLKPISLYNKTKMIAERIFYSYKKDFEIIIVRPATICGFSRKMRLDLTVNALTFHALSKKLITIHGGEQIRPNIHIKDMINVYDFFLNNQVESGFYNAGFENQSIIEIANLISDKIKCETIIDKNTNDPRSYRQNSGKILNMGFLPKHSINDAIEELIIKFNNNEIKEDINCYTIKKLSQILSI